MKKRHTNSLITSITLTLIASLIPRLPALADVNCSDNSIPLEVREAAGCSGNTDDFPHVIIGIINAVLGIIGLVAVIVIIYAGVQYMTSIGDVQKVKKAKDTLLYAAIGLIICVLSFAIVNFVVAKFLGN